MSGYLVSLVQRARGEGTALQPRVRARFEPRGFEEVSAEVEMTQAPAPSRHAPVVDEPHVPVVRDVPAVASLSVDDHVETFHEVRTITRAETPAIEPPAPIVITPPIATSPEIARPSLPSGATGSQPVETEPQTSTATEADGLRARRSRSAAAREIEIERERLTPRPPLRVHTTRSVERHTHRDTTRIVTPPHEEDAAEPQPIRITIGRIDVRAIAPPAQSRPSPGAPKRNAPLTLDDYLRRRDGGKR